MKIHFIGIGGIGVSAISRFYLKKGYQISGSDLERSEITDGLKKLKVKIYIGKHKSKNLSTRVDLVIFSPATALDNPELIKAKKYKINTKSYPEALGDLTKEYFTIAVSGTHGKSTTTSLISLILIKAGFDPTVIIGTKLKEFNNSNFRSGKSKYLIIEADEWNASFLNYWPNIIVLTNIEKEHLDYYKNLSHILKTYRKYLLRLPEDGILVANKDDKNILKLIKGENKFKVKEYSLQQKTAKELIKVLKVPGVYNISNALAALTTAKIIKIPEKIIFSALAKYKGTWRRFEILKEKPYVLISDYAHHPTEILAALSAVREKYRKRKVWAVFQPHQYQRTYYLFKDFIKSFDLADEIILTEIYQVAGREEGGISKKVSSNKLAENIRKRGKKVYFINDFKKISQLLKDKAKSKDIILVMGAGNIYKLTELL